jgi:Transglutaminase-like superfamily
VSKWRRFRRLAPAERNTLLWALVMLPVTGAALRTVGFRRWKEILEKNAARAAVRPARSAQVSQAEILEESRRTARMVNAAAREGIHHARCLEQSLTLWWLLARRGTASELRIGVRQSATGFEAHAWVEVRGTAVNDNDTVHQEYVPLGRDIGTLRVESQ